ncbi:hypothetical protein PFISCL1PPCAC_12396, partial [Pristionchus fissidentatus]
QSPEPMDLCTTPPPAAVEETTQKSVATVRPFAEYNPASPANSSPTYLLTSTKAIGIGQFSTHFATDNACESLRFLLFALALAGILYQFPHKCRASEAKQGDRTV